MGFWKKLQIELFFSQKRNILSLNCGPNKSQLANLAIVGCFSQFAILQTLKCRIFNPTPNSSSESLL